MVVGRHSFKKKENVLFLKYIFYLNPSGIMAPIRSQCDSEEFISRLFQRDIVFKQLQKMNKIYTMEKIKLQTNCQTENDKNTMQHTM